MTQAAGGGSGGASSDTGGTADDTSTTGTATNDGPDASGDGSGTAEGDAGSSGDPPCIDADGDGHGANCPAGEDCDDDNAAVWTDAACQTCIDADGDGWVGVCDDYPGVDGPDCDDTDPCNWTEAGCANCVDTDRDGYFTGCDIYCGELDGPDCDDSNPVVTDMDITELCNGVAENCAGQIDPLDPADMCPAPGQDDPSVGTWACDPPSPGEDGCTIAECAAELFDVDGEIGTGCECPVVPASDQGLSCDAPIDLGDFTDDGSMITVSGNVLPLDREVWYRFRAVDLPEANCDNFHVDVRFTDNPDDQFVFQIARGGCGVPLTECTYAYSWAVDFRISVSGVLTGHCPCSSAPPASTPDNVSICDDFTSEYFILVTRDPGVSAPPTCAGYQLEITNGVYDTA